MTVSKNKSTIAALRLNWKGQFIISFTSGEEYTISVTGIGWFQIRYVLRNKAQEELIQFDPHFKWKKLGYDYTIKVNKGEYDWLISDVRRFRFELSPGFYYVLNKFGILFYFGLQEYFG